MSHTDLKLPRTKTASLNSFAKYIQSYSTGGLKAAPLQGRNTKIVCTIGPISQSVDAMIKLLQAGMNVARMNFSHGVHEFHKQTVLNVREAVRVTGLPCAILLDTKGPEIRTGMLENGHEILLEKGQKINIHCCKRNEMPLGTKNDIAVDHPNLTQYISKGTLIKIDDGVILITVDEIQGNKIIGTVMNTKELGQQKGVNIPGCETGLPVLTDKDIADLKFGIKHRVDIIAPSFVNSAKDVRGIREILGEEGAYIKIISKIESVYGLKNFDEILAESDGIMVARGDLGVEIPIEKVCLAQKTMINKCNAVGKPVITATQMLDSMIKNPYPTRAEATDVANACVDGSDCVMLSGETAKGKYGCEAVSVMARICLASESSLDHEALFLTILSHSSKPVYQIDFRTEAVTSAAVKTAIDLKARLIIVLTSTGRTAKFVAKYRPPMPVITVTPDEVVARQCLIRRAIWPLVVKEEFDDDSRYEHALEFARKKNWISKGDCVVVVSGKHNVAGSAYQMRVNDV